MGAAIEKPFTEVGRDIVGAKKEELIQIYAAYINEYNHPEPIPLVRGNDPYLAAEYVAVPPDSISKALTAAAVGQLAGQMLPIVQKEILGMSSSRLQTRRTIRSANMRSWRTMAL